MLGFADSMYFWLQYQPYGASLGHLDATENKYKRLHWAIQSNMKDFKLLILNLIYRYWFLNELNPGYQILHK